MTYNFYQIHVLIFLSLIFFSCSNQSEISPNLETNESAVVLKKIVDTKMQDSINLECGFTREYVENSDEFNKFFMYDDDHTMSLKLVSHMTSRHRILCYDSPSLTANPILLYSIYTSDVQNNPFGFEFGAYYDEIGPDSKMYFLGFDGDFVKAEYIDKAGKEHIVYFERHWLEMPK